MATATAPPCPLCGAPLQPVALDPATAPWLCKGDARGWWQVELDAASLFHAPARDYGQSAHTLTVEVAQERDAAFVRGTSARPESLPLLTDEVLAELSRRTGLATGFARQVTTEQQRRKRGGA